MRTTAVWTTRLVNTHRIPEQRRKIKIIPLGHVVCYSASLNKLKFLNPLTGGTFCQHSSISLRGEFLSRVDSPSFSLRPPLFLATPSPCPLSPSAVKGPMRAMCPTEHTASPSFPFYFPFWITLCCFEPTKGTLFTHSLSQGYSADKASGAEPTIRLLQDLSTSQGRCCPTARGMTWQGKNPCERS